MARLRSCDQRNHPFGLFLAPAIGIAWLGETLLPQIPAAWGLA
jgi:hypothetical protein